MLLNPFHRPSKADDFTEMIFQYRNKNYGAYVLRKDYNEHASKALLITVGSLALFLSAVLVLQSGVQNVMMPGSGTSSEPDTYQTTPPDIEKPKVEKQKQTAPPPDVPNLTSTVRVTNDTTTVRMPDSTDTTITPAGPTATGTDPNTTPGNGSINPGGKGNVPDSFNVNKVWGFSEVRPEFPGGEEALNRYLSDKISCRGRWLEDGSSGNIVFSMVVNRFGEISDVKVEIDNVHFDCAEQAMQVIKNMPRWHPGMQNHIPVNVKYIIPISYKRDND